jgi:hypothetical protein
MSDRGLRANAIMLNRNGMLTVRLINYPLKGESAAASVKEVVGALPATSFGKYVQ